MKLRKSALCIASLALLCPLLFSACGSGEEERRDKEPDIPGRITQETGSAYNYIGWWQLADQNEDAPFVFIEIPVDDSSVVNCYDANIVLLDTGYTDYSEQRALNGNNLMVFAFQNIGEYGVTPYSSVDNRYLSIRDNDQLKIELKALGEGIEPVPSDTPPDAPVADDTSPDESDALTIELSAENADLTDAPDVLLEPDAPPKNIGGWKANNKVAWEFEISVEGNYTIGVLYSRPVVSTDVQGTVNVYAQGNPEPITLTFRADTTGDWSIYQSNDTMSVRLEPGAYRLEIIPGTPGYPLIEDHFINLRSIKLLLAS